MTLIATPVQISFVTFYTTSIETQVNLDITCHVTSFSQMTLADETYIIGTAAKTISKPFFTLNPLVCAASYSATLNFVPPQDTAVF